MRDPGYERKIKVCYFLAYREPNYIRTKNILSGLGSNDCVELFVVRNSSRGLFRYIESLVKLIKVLRKSRPDILVLGFRGLEIYPMIRLLLPGSRIVVDEMMSPSAALIEERNLLSRLLGKILIYPVERWIMRDCACILTDTVSHVEFLSDFFRLPKEKFEAVPVCADESLMSTPHLTDKKMVLFYGSFLPLHGFAVILKAMAMLSERNLEFCFIGLKGRNKEQLEALANTKPGLNVSIVSYVPFDELISNYLAKAWLFLGGPFGGTPQAMRVITGKAAQAMSMGIPTVLGENQETFGLIDKRDALIVRQGDPVALSGAIRWALEHEDELENIGNNGRYYYMQKLSMDVVKDKLQTVIERFIQ